MMQTNKEETKRVFPPQPERVETGVIQFGDDWPGLFVRGDNCMGYQCALDMIEFSLKNPDKPNSNAWALAQLESLRALFKEPIGK